MIIIDSINLSTIGADSWRGRKLLIAKPQQWDINLQLISTNNWQNNLNSSPKSSSASPTPTTQLRNSLIETASLTGLSSEHHPVWGVLLSSFKAEEDERLSPKSEKGKAESNKSEKTATLSKKVSNGFHTCQPSTIRGFADVRAGN